MFHLEKYLNKFDKIWYWRRGLLLKAGVWIWFMPLTAVTCWMTERSGFDSSASRPALLPTQPFIKEYRWLLLRWWNGQGVNPYQSSLSRAEVKNVWSHTSIPSHIFTTHSYLWLYIAINKHQQPSEMWHQVAYLRFYWYFVEKIVPANIRAYKRLQRMNIGVSEWSKAENFAKIRTLKQAGTLL